VEPSELNQKFFSTDTQGYKIIKWFYYKYRDLFQRTNFPQFKEFLHQVFLNISKINFSKEIQNEEAYVIGSIKIQCRVQLDQALKIKNRMVDKTSEVTHESTEDNSLVENLESNNPGPLETLEMQEVFQAINIFKLSLKAKELELFNSLIDNISRKDLSEKYQINLNTLDTQIRRLRIKLLTYLKNCGYSFKIFSKYGID
jgi:DNA-binding CsgD family transcriptional regulator